MQSDDEILKRDALGRVRNTPQRREALLDEFFRSGLPATKFAAMVGINYQTFASWVQRRRRAMGAYDKTTPIGSDAPEDAQLSSRSLLEAVVDERQDGTPE